MFVRILIDFILLIFVSFVVNVMQYIYCRFILKEFANTI